MIQVWQKIKKVERAARWWLAGIFFVTLLIPATREMHVMTFRLLLNLRGNTIVQGQPPICTILTIPNTTFSEAYESRLRADSKTSPEAYFRALSVGSGDLSELEIPPAHLWQKHPLLEWSSAFAVWRANDSWNTNGQYKTNARGLLELAQSEHPDNGALWLAQAALEFTSGHNESALAALREATSKTNWFMPETAHTRYSDQLLESAGYSRLDAAIYASRPSAIGFIPRISQIIRANWWTNAIEQMTAGNHEAVTELVQLRLQLGRPIWSGVRCENYLQFFELWDDNLANLIACNLELPSVPISSSTNYELRKSSRDLILEMFLRKYAPAAANQTLETNRVVTKAREQRHNQDWERDKWMLLTEGIASASGALALAFGAFLMTLTLYECVFSIRRQGERDDWLPRNVLFWAMAASSILVASQTLACFLNAIAHEPGLSEGPKPEVTFESLWTEAFIFSIGLFLIKLLLRLVEKRLWQPAATWICLAWPYLFAIILAAIFRYKTMLAIMARDF